MERAVDTIALKAAEASRQQEEQIELLATSVKFAKELQLTMQVIHSMLEKIFGMAASLTTLMESVARKAKQLSVFSWDSPYTWLSLALMAFALGKQKFVLATSVISMFLGKFFNRLFVWCIADLYRRAQNRACSPPPTRLSLIPCIFYSHSHHSSVLTRRTNLTPTFFIQLSIRPPACLLYHPSIRPNHSFLTTDIYRDTFFRLHFFVFDHSFITLHS